MKRVFCSLFTGVLCLAVSMTAVSQDITSGLEAYFPFDEFDGTQAEDASGQGRHADVLAGEPILTGGKVGNAMFFDGDSDLTVTGYQGISGNAPRTVSYWTRSTSTGNMGAVGWGTSASPNGQKWHVRYNDNAGNGVVGAPRTEIQGSYIIGNTNVNDGEWHHVVSVFTGTFMQDTIHYVDGVEDGRSGIGNQELEVNTLTDDTTPDVTIGSRLQGANYNRLVGALDDVRIYDRALSAEDVQALYALGAGGADLVGERTIGADLVKNGESFTVNIDIANPASGTLTETVPDGWDISEISNGGTADGQIISWDLTDSTTSVSYKLTLPEDAAEVETVFSGEIDGLLTRGDANVDVVMLQGPVGIFDQHADIGNVAIPGSASLNGEEYEVIASGADIWGTQDQFHFVFSELEGPFSIQANVFLTGEGMHEWAKAGLMIRDELSADAVHYDSIVRYSDFGQDAQWRLEKGGTSASTASNINLDQLGDIRLVRNGDMLETYYLNLETDEWTLYDSRLVVMEDPVYVGLCVTSHDNTVTNTGLFTNVELNLEPYSASRSITQGEGRFMYGDSAEVKVGIFVRDQQEASVVETLPAGWIASDLQPSAGEAAVNGDGAIEWTIGDHQGEAELVYTLTAPEVSDTAVAEGAISGTLNGNEIDGDSDILAVGFVAKEILDQQDYESAIEGYWTFDNWDGSVASDTSGNGYDATIAAGEPVAANGVLGGALELDGESNLTVPWTGVQGGTHRTISLWMKTTGAGPIFVSWGNDVEGEKWHFRINDNAGNGNVNAIRTEYAGGNQTVATTPVNDGEWHHIASVFEGTEPKHVIHYVDGLYDPNTWVMKEGTIINTVSDETHNVFLGSGPDGGRSLEGTMDDVRIYSRALSAEEIQALYLGTGGTMPTSVEDFMLY